VVEQKILKAKRGRVKKDFDKDLAKGFKKNLGRVKKILKFTLNNVKLDKITLGN
jgi:hypothetical protein